MAKAKGTPPPAEMRAVADFCVGVRHINAGEVLPADDLAVIDVPGMFEPVAVGESGAELVDLPAGSVILPAKGLEG